MLSRAKQGNVKPSMLGIAACNLCSAQGKLVAAFSSVAVIGIRTLSVLFGVGYHSSTASVICAWPIDELK